MAKDLGFNHPDGRRKNFTDFKYLSKCNDLGEDYDKREFKEMYDAFINLGFTPAEIKGVY